VISLAVELLRRGGLVAFPTETVYGLGADATNPTAVRRIFAAKSRPGTNPLIVHVADASIARRYARTWPKAADELARRFWPGPLTLVLPKAESIVPETTAGRDSVGLRSPDHPLALQLLREFDGPIAAPSANRSNRVSPTTAEHVRRELGGAVDIILDGGPCRVGIESTVLDLTGKMPVILRPGSVTRAQLEQAIGRVEVFEGNISPDKAAHSPGQQAVHYSPVAPAHRFTSSESEQLASWCGAHAEETIVVMGIAGSATSIILKDSPSPRLRLILMPNDPDEYARRLYAALHEADGPGVGAIRIEMPDDLPSWIAIRDRIIRATRAL